MTPIQISIRHHPFHCDGLPTTHSMLCFVGMIETGEATWDDFREVGGDVLVAAIAKAKEKLDDKDE